MARVALCQDIMVEYMGIMSISGALKSEGHNVDVFFDNQLNDDRFLDQLAEFKPDIVGFSILSTSLAWSLRMGRKVKDRLRVPTIYGNVHAIVCPEIIEDPAVDIVCIGEGEDAMRDLCRAIDARADYSQIPGLWVKTPERTHKNPMRSQLVDLDALPYHDRVLYDKYPFFRKSAYLRVESGRGCPFHCAFCTNPVLAELYGPKRYIRKRSPERVIRELEHTIRQRPRKVTFLFFVDEVFWVKNDWLREFLALYKQRIGLPFCASLRFGPLEEDDVRMMAEAGASALSFAVETGNENQRRGLLNKNVSDEQIFKLAALLRKYKINYCATAFFGLPGDTFQDHVERLPFYRKVNPTYLWTTFFQPLPGTALAKHPDVLALIPEKKAFARTFHNESFLEVPDKQRLEALKKVYFLCMKFPRLQRTLLALTKFRIPILFDALFLIHFTYYVSKFEHVSFAQWLVHLKIFALTPLLARLRPKPRRHTQNQT